MEISDIGKSNDVAEVVREIEGIKNRLDKIERAVFGMDADHQVETLEGIGEETDPDRIAGRLSMANPL
jgi:hypothetical protein